MAATAVVRALIFGRVVIDRRRRRRRRGRRRSWSRSRSRGSASESAVGVGVGRRWRRRLDRRLRLRRRRRRTGRTPSRPRSAVVAKSRSVHRSPPLKPLKIHGFPESTYGLTKPFNLLKKRQLPLGAGATMDPPLRPHPRLDLRPRQLPLSGLDRPVRADRRAHGRLYPAAARLRRGRGASASRRRISTSMGRRSPG